MPRGGNTMTPTCHKSSRYWYIICEQIWERGTCKFVHFPKFQLLNANNFDTIVAMDLKRPAIILLHSLRIPSPTHFLCEHAYYLWLKIGRFTPPVWRPPLLTGGHLQLQMWDLWSRRPDVPHKPLIKVRGPHCFEIVIAWKLPNFGVSCEVAPFLKSTLIW